MEAFFAEADAISLHMRLVDAMRGIVTGDDLVNTSRAPLIEAGAPEGGPAWHGSG